mgnify:CR=1 FL=1
MLREHATHYYMEDNCNCAEAVLMAANAEYGLGLSDDACKLVGGFGAGMGLPNMKRNADGFSIESEVGKGTRIEMRFNLA